MTQSTGSSCYSLVGNNRFTNIPLRNLVVRVTPLPQDYILFQSGDVLGIYVEDARQTDDGVVVLTSDRSTDFTSELVWYASIAPTMATSQNGYCPYLVGSDGVLNTMIQGAPVISVSITMYSCSGPSPLATPTATEVSTTPINSEMPFPITSSPRIPSLSDGGGGAFVSATPLPGALTIGTVVPLLVIIVVLTVVVIVLAAILLKTKHRKSSMRGRKSTDLTTDLNVAYGLLREHQDVDEMCMGMLSGRASLHLYESLPSLSTSSKNRNRNRNTQQSLVYNEAYAGRNEALATDFLDANETPL